MSILETLKSLMNIRPVSIGELNRRATRDPVPQVRRPAAKSPLDGIHITDEYNKVHGLIEARCPVVFVTGNAGTGKSTLIRAYLRKPEAKFRVEATLRSPVSAKPLKSLAPRQGTTRWISPMLSGR